MMVTPHCPACGSVVFFESLECPACSTELGFHRASGEFAEARPEGVLLTDPRGGEPRLWRPCSNRAWRCNWLAPDGEASAQCLSCRLTRRRPDNDDTLSLEKLAVVAADKRRLLMQLIDLGLPITPYYEQEGGLAFDLVSSLSNGERVIIGHANGVITIDLAESLDAYRERLRVRLGEPYRTVLGHFRHEIGHYYQSILLDTDELWAECRALFGDERASYQDALKRHYDVGAPAGWIDEYISDYATMHPWEDFAETFAHYLHITGTLSTAANSGVLLQAERIAGFDHGDVLPRASYRDATFDEVLSDWTWLSLMFNRVNRSMGLKDLYPFGIVAPVARKLAFVHRIVVRAGAARAASSQPG
ncbi:putative zinc-binding peptidase [Herbiconiux moechotypicola]|uniref:Zinc-binding metallopeptidase n=1 Tax=Herbiconiux moechotypicola TaxID=637393 RepID=A0ABN3DAL5_9MICO|nr:putative zinc-binding metallopeptidase [Herbiconiux moechotypicola]MCS5728943.1 putative zinc-binding peptidase [Herbiconiux moechotypicola]